MPSTPLPIIPGGFRLANNYKTQDAKFTNVFWLIATPGSHAADVADDFQHAYTTGTSFKMLSLHSVDVTMVNCQVTPLDGASPTEVVPWPSSTDGTGVGVAAAANACFVLTLQTANRGRNKRGRTYLGGCPQASLEAGSARWSPAFIADANIATSDFLIQLSLGSTGADLYVVSQHSAAGPSNSLVTVMRANSYVGSQRRRTERNE